MKKHETSTQVIAGEADDSDRADRVLARHVAGLSRTRIQALIRAGQVLSGGRTLVDPGHTVKRGDVLVLSVPEPEAAEPAPEDIPLAIVFEDAHLIVVDKPAGLVVHPAAGHAKGTLVNALVAHCGASLSGIGGVRRPGIVHRLDKDTSGLLVVAKTDAAHQGLSAQFAAHGRDGRLERAYMALAWGRPTRPRGIIDAPLARSASNRTRIAVAKSGGTTGAREAVTHYEVLETFQAEDGAPVASLMRLVLETGRTHQIRVHLAHIGHPLLGDPVYGSGFKTSASRLPAAAAEALAALERQALHAAVLGFEHPVTGRPMHFESALPADLARLVKALESSRARPAPRSSSSSRIPRRPAG